MTVSADSIPTTAPHPRVDVVDVSVVIVTYNVREFLEQALQSVRAASEGLNVEVFVVDNDSADGSADMVRARFPDVRLIANHENAGFSRANNQAIREANGRYLLILNPDTILQEDTLVELTRFLDEHPDAGAVGCQILNPDGSFARESRRAFPTPDVAFYRISGLSRLFPRSRRFGRYNMTFLPRDEVAEVDALSGSCMMVRHAALFFDPDEAHEQRMLNGRATGEALRAARPGNGAGLLDEDFFMYGEDLDWCYRIQHAGWKIYYTPSTRIIHYKGESTKKGELRYVRLFYGAMIKFADKHFDGRYSSLFALAIRGAIFGRAAISVTSRLFRRIAHPLLELAIVFLIVSVLGAAAVGASARTALFYTSVAGGFSVMYVLAATVAGAYKRSGRRRLRPVWRSITIAFILMAAVSFFVKDIAYSRLLLLASFAASGIAVSVLRLSMRRRHAHGDSRVLLVGNSLQADRLERMLARLPSPPFVLVGHVSVEDEPLEGEDRRSLGELRQLRDLVRIHRIDDVVFSSCCLTNQQMFLLMQQLHDLPLQFRILTEQPDRIIGKSSIDEFEAPPLIDASRTIQAPRSRLARRAFEIPVAMMGLAMYPLTTIMASARPHSAAAARLREKSRQLGRVLRGRCALVGYDPSLGFVPPPEWRLAPGIFSITDTIPRNSGLETDLQQAYWFYMQNQSASSDWDIMLRSLRSGRR